MYINGIYITFMAVSSSVGFSCAEKWSSASLYFQILIVRSIPADAILVGEMNLTDLMLAVCPPEPAEGDVAIAWPDLFQTRNNPS